MPMRSAVARVIRVSTNPGATVLTLTLNGPTSTPSLPPIPRTPPLAPHYLACPRGRPRSQIRPRPPRALGRKQPRGGGADPAPAAGHKRNPILELHSVSVSSAVPPSLRGSEAP